MSLTLNIVSRAVVAPNATFADHATANQDYGSGPGRAVIMLGAVSSADATTGQARPGWARVGSAAGAGGTLMSKGAPIEQIPGGFVYSRLFYLASAAIDAAGSGLTGVKESWMACTLADDTTLDGNRKPGFECLVVQSSDGRALTAGDIATAVAQISGSLPATQAAGSPSVEAVGIVMVHSDGSVLGTATAPASLLATGLTDGASFTLEAIQALGTGAALTIDWQPGSINQNHARHMLSLTAAATAPQLTGAATWDLFSASGSISSLAPSSVSGVADWNLFSASGSIAPRPGTVTTFPFTRNSGSLPVSLPNNALAVLSDDPSLARLAGGSGLSLGGDGRLSLTDPGLTVPGTSVLVVTREADGKLGVERYTIS